MMRKSERRLVVSSECSIFALHALSRCGILINSARQFHSLFLFFSLLLREKKQCTECLQSTLAMTSSTMNGREDCEVLVAPLLRSNWSGAQRKREGWIAVVFNNLTLKLYSPFVKSSIRLHCTSSLFTLVTPIHHSLLFVSAQWSQFPLCFVYFHIFCEKKNIKRIRAIHFCWVTREYRIVLALASRHNIPSNYDHCFNRMHHWISSMIFVTISHSHICTKYRLSAASKFKIIIYDPE